MTCNMLLGRELCVIPVDFVRTCVRVHVFISFLFAFLLFFLQRGDKNQKRAYHKYHWLCVTKLLEEYDTNSIHVLLNSY